MYDKPELAEIGVIADVVLGPDEGGDDSDLGTLIPFEGIVCGLDD